MMAFGIQSQSRDSYHKNVSLSLNDTGRSQRHEIDTPAPANRISPPCDLPGSFAAPPFCLPILDRFRSDVRKVVQGYAPDLLRESIEFLRLSMSAAELCDTYKETLTSALGMFHAMAKELYALYQEDNKKPTSNQLSVQIRVAELIHASINALIMATLSCPRGGHSIRRCQRPVRKLFS